MKTKKLYLILLAALCLLPALTKAQWQAVRFDQRNYFSKVFAVTPDTAFVNGTAPANGDDFVLRTNNGGASWDSLVVSSSVSLHLYKLYFSDVNTGFTGGSKNSGQQALYKTLNNGTSWTDITPDPVSTEAITAIYFLNALQGYAASYSHLYSTTNGGATWTVQNTSFTANDLHFSSMSNGYATGTSNTSLAVIFYTTNGGQSWNTFFSQVDPNLFVSSFTKTDVLNAGVMVTSMEYTNKLYKTVDGGLTWDTIVIDSIYSIHDFQFTSADSGHVLSDYGEIYSTADGGQSWHKEYATEWGFYGPSIYLYSISFSGNTGYVCGTNGLIKKHTLLTGITETTNAAEQFAVYPNPFISSGTLVLQTGENDAAVQVNITDASGQLVFTKQYTTLNNKAIELPDLHLAPGMYFISLATKEIRRTQKLVVSE